MNEKLAEIRKSREAQCKTHDRIRDVLAPFHARSISTFPGPRDTFVMSCEVFSVYSREADCGGNPEKGEPHDRHKLRGVVLVQYFRDGGAQVLFAEDIVCSALALDPEITEDDSWERTAAVLSKLLD